MTPAIGQFLTEQIAAQSGLMVQNSCYAHIDREAKFVINQTSLSLCEQCADYLREAGEHVRPLLGFLFGFPVLNSEDDGILDCRVIYDLDEN